MDKKSLKSAKQKVWQPRSRIAGYIKGEVKLEDIVGVDKLVRPEQRHNKRAFMPHLNDDNEESFRRTNESTTNSRNSSRKYRCPSSVKTSVSKITVSETDDFSQTSADKNEQISQLQRQIETFRECVYTTEVQYNEDVEAAVSTLLDCLVNLAATLQSVDSNDERITAFVNRVQHERQRWFTFATSVQEEVHVLRNLNENLQISNGKKDDRLNEAIAENTKLQAKLKTLQEEFESLQRAHEHMRQVHENIVANKQDSHERNEKLHDRILEYERIYERTAKELSFLSELSDSVRKEFQADIRTLDDTNRTTNDRIQELEEKIHSLEDACRGLRESKYKTKAHVTEIEKRYQKEIETLKEASEKYVSSLKHETNTLEQEVKQLRDNERSLRQENDNLRATLLQLANKYRLLKEDAEYARCQKATLEKALKNMNKSSDVSKVKENVSKTLLELEEMHLNKLMEYLEETIRSTEILPQETIR